MTETRPAAALPAPQGSIGTEAHAFPGAHTLLTLRVHFEAAIGDPAQYAKSLWWRLLRKRLRARRAVAPILGSSAHAYELWLARSQYAAALAPKSEGEHGPVKKIVAIVDTFDGILGLNDSLRSLSDEGVEAIVLCREAAALGVESCTEAESLAAAAEAIDWQEQPWLLPMSAGDVLAVGAAQHYRAAAAGDVARVVYADDDLLKPGGRRVSPHFKPDWNSELYSHFDYLSGSCIVQATRKELLAVAWDSDWRRCLISNVIRESTPLHVHRVLHHRRTRSLPRVPVRPLEVVGNRPPVTVIVPTRNRVDLLRTCLSGLVATDYRDLSVIVVDNGSDDPATLAYLHDLDRRRFEVMRYDGPFNFAAINNHAAKKTQDPLLCLLNNDIEVIEPTWLATMVQQAMRSDVGAVGAQLLYPDGRTQHAGVVLGVGGGTGHAHRLSKPSEEGYFWRHQLPQYVSAVTGACLVVQRDRFLAIGGFDDENFTVAFNDVDLCMRLNQHGWQSLYEPRAQLVHHESVSRGWDRDPVGARRFAGELAALKRKWVTDNYVDPYHHPNLSRFSERFVVAL